ncbi:MULTISPECIES: recombinase [Mitsuokella]|uniref:recombinase n=1 Tax=Mitsuokella TaxID=52225 RepID=UPI00242D42B5|nr:recombinase [Mitsuokella multacida]
MPNAPWVICRWHITEEEIKVAFVTAFNKLVTEREEIAANARLVRQTLCDIVELEREKAALGQESLKGLAKASLAVLVEMTQNCIAENARGAQDQSEYQISSEPQDFPACESLMHSKRYNGLVERYEKAKTRFDEVTEAIAQRSAKSERLAGFIRTLEAQREPVAEFDERLWGAMVDYVTVGVDGGMTVVFRNGTDILV